MKRAGKTILIIFLGLFVISLVDAADTEINVKTMPAHEVKVTVLEHTESELQFVSLAYLPSKTSDQYGDAKFIYSGSQDSFDLAITIKKDGEQILFKKYRENYPAGNPIKIELVPSWFQIIPTPGSEPIVANTSVEENQTIVEEPTETIEQISNTSTPEIVPIVTGEVVSNNVAGSYNVYIYVIFGFFVLFAVVLITMKATKKKIIKDYENENENEHGKEIKVRKLSDLKDEKRERIQDYNHVIEEAERKIREAQEEIRKLKTSNELIEKEKKIEEAKRKLIEDQKELMRLREDLKR